VCPDKVNHRPKPKKVVCGCVSSRLKTLRHIKLNLLWATLRLAPTINLIRFVAIKCPSINHPRDVPQISRKNSRSIPPPPPLILIIPDRTTRPRSLPKNTILSARRRSPRATQLKLQTLVISIFQRFELLYLCPPLFHRGSHLSRIRLLLVCHGRPPNPTRAAPIGPRFQNGTCPHAIYFDS
jgi:hypothetical protein